MKSNSKFTENQPKGIYIFIMNKPSLQIFYFFKGKTLEIENCQRISTLTEQNALCSVNLFQWSEYILSASLFVCAIHKSTQLTNQLDYIKVNNKWTAVGHISFNERNVQSIRRCPVLGCIECIRYVIFAYHLLDPYAILSNFFMNMKKNLFWLNQFHITTLQPPPLGHCSA